MIPLPKGSAPYGFIAIGLLFFIYGAGHLWRTYEFESRAIGAIATVVGVNAEMMQGAFDEPGQTTARIYRPVFAFEDQYGTLRRVTSDTASSTLNLPIGTPIPIVYDPQDPDFARFDTKVDMWSGPIVQTVMGALFLAVGFWLFSLKRSRA